MGKEFLEQYLYEKKTIQGRLACEDIIRINQIFIETFAVRRKISDQQYNSLKNNKFNTQLKLMNYKVSFNILINNSEMLSVYIIKSVSWSPGSVTTYKGLPQN